MKFFAHAINTLDELKSLDRNCGVEIDVRDNIDRLVLGHDPFSRNYQDLEEYLKFIEGRSIIAKRLCAACRAD